MTGRRLDLRGKKTGGSARRLERRGVSGLRRSVAFFCLAFVLAAQWAWSQRLGPLVFDDRRQSKAAPAERAAAARPPSLSLRLPPPAAAVLPPLGTDDLQRLRPREGLKPVGVHRALPEEAVVSSFSDGATKTTVAGAWRSTAAGRLWRLRTTSPGARALRFHFQDFDVGAGSVWVHAADGRIAGPYSGRGAYDDGDFWSGIVLGESATIEYLPDPAAPTEEAAPFRIAAVSHLWSVPGSAGDGAPQAQAAAAEESQSNGKTLAEKPLKKSVAAMRSLAGGPLSPARNTGGPLTPGQPAAFSLGPVNNPTLFAGFLSFRLEVPANAARVTFTLNSVDPGVDVDLFVRFGEDPGVADGRVVADYSSTGGSGNEEIVIDRHSDPPLQTGTYFIALALFDTGVIARGTLTATLELEEPPPSEREAGGPLTPGQPAAFRLGPVGSPTLFNGDLSFRFEVPAGVTYATFTLESADPGVDVDLFVRFGQDTARRDGSIVRDYASRSNSGNEKIGVTRFSDPPLQAGTYFVSLLLYDTGAAAAGTLTAQLGTIEDCHLDAVCYPEWSRSAAGVAQILFARDGGLFVCSGTLLNNRRQDFTPYFLTAAHCVNSEEQARSVIAFWFHQTQHCNAGPPARSSAQRTEGARLLATLGDGVDNGRAHPDGDMTLLQLAGELPAGIVFQGWDANPQPVDAQVAGIHHPGNDLWGAYKRIAFGRIVPDRRPGDAPYAIVSHLQGYTERGSSGSALFSRPETVVGALSFGQVRENENACPTDLRDGYTHFSVFYPHIRQFLDTPFPEGAPRISAGGVVLAAGIPAVNRISPNAIVSVFGQDFAPPGTQAVNPALNAAGRVASVLAGLCLEIDGKRAPLFAVFPNQINAQAPHDLAPGQARVEVVRGCGTEAEQRGRAATVEAAAVSPMFFNFVSNANGRNPVAALHGGGPALAGAPGLLPGAVFTPAAPGEYVTLFGTGFGATEPPLEAGRIPARALPDGLARLADTVSFTFDGIAVPPEDVYYAGAAPCCAGLYQLTVRVPPALPDGDAPVIAAVQGVSTPAGPFLTVRRQ